MSNYPIWWEDTITIYNRYEDKQTSLITWHRTVIHNCFWKASGNKVKVSDIVLDSDSLICRIPKDANYLNPREWEQLSNDVMDNYFTLRQNDIVVRGEIEDEINEYQKGQRANDFIEKYKYDGCFTIKKIAINTGTGKNNEHYYISGD